MKIYLRVLAVIYFIGGILHVLDVFDLRLKFSEMSSVWQAWIIYLMIFDILAAIGLWQQKKWGISLFLLIAISQLIAYICFSNVFGRQYSLIAIHVVTLAVYQFLKWTGSRKVQKI